MPKRQGLQSFLPREEWGNCEEGSKGKCKNHDGAVGFPLVRRRGFCQVGAVAMQKA